MFLFKPKFLILLAVFSGLLATIAIRGYMQEREAQLAKAGKLNRPVVVAAIALSFGDSLSELNLEVKHWPPELVPAGSFATEREVVGRVLRTDMVVGEPILETRLAPTGSSGGVLSQIPTGMRAMTVSVNVVSGVGGFVLPKTRVDILATIRKQGSQDETATRTILQDVLILAVDQEFRKNDTDPVIVKSVTLLVTPEQAERLALASTEGKLQLVLRNTADSDSVKTAGYKLNQFTGGSEPKPAPVARPVARSNPRPAPVFAKPVELAPVSSKTTRVEVIRSNERTQVEFDEHGQTVPQRKR